MTTAQLIQYYANLLILQYVGKPKAYATIGAVVGPVLMGVTGDPNTQLPLAVQNAYNLFGPNPAQGVQLDVLGKYAGVTRTGRTFSGGTVTLNDTEFLTLIQMAILKNNAGSSLATIQQLLNQFFPGEILTFDYSNMHMSYLINSSIGSPALIQLFVGEGLLPKPMGVQLAVVIYTPVIDMFFGMTEYEQFVLTGQIEPNATPFNDYVNYHSDWPWLSYVDAIGPTYQQLLATQDGDILTTEGGEPLGVE